MEPGHGTSAGRTSPQNPTCRSCTDRAPGIFPRPPQRESKFQNADSSPTPAELQVKVRSRKMRKLLSHAFWHPGLLAFMRRLPDAMPHYDLDTTRTVRLRCSSAKTCVCLIRTVDVVWQASRLHWARLARCRMCFGAQTLDGSLLMLKADHLGHHSRDCREWLLVCRLIPKQRNLEAPARVAPNTITITGGRRLGA